MKIDVKLKRSDPAVLLSFGDCSRTNWKVSSLLPNFVRKMSLKSALIMDQSMNKPGSGLSKFFVIGFGMTF